MGAGDHAPAPSSWILEGAGVAVRRPASDNSAVAAPASCARSGVHGAHGVYNRSSTWKMLSGAWPVDVPARAAPATSERYPQASYPNRCE